jgi:hypothetical protein
MSPDAASVAVTRRALGLWNEVAAAYDAIERRLSAGAWDQFEEVATHIATLEHELQPLLVEIAVIRAGGTMPEPALAKLWHDLDLRVEALARRQKLLERAAVGARDTTAARLVRTRIARSRAAGYTPLNPLSPRLTSQRV